MSTAFVMASLSVCLSVTLVIHVLTAEDIEVCFVPYDRGTYVVSGDQILQC